MTLEAGLLDLSVAAHAGHHFRADGERGIPDEPFHGWRAAIVGVTEIDCETQAKTQN